jgi:hypothetical protein
MSASTSVIASEAKQPRKLAMYLSSLRQTALWGATACGLAMTGEEADK